MPPKSHKEHPVTDHMNAAVEAGKLALCKHYNEWEDGQIVWESQADIQEEINEFTDAAESALYAMLPHLRAMIAQEILDHVDDIPLNGLPYYRDGIYAGMVSAALLVREPQQ